MNIILTGPRGVGKTRKGKIIAKFLNYRLIDTDELLEKRYNTTINKIVKEKGWKEFRKMENENIKYITSKYKEKVVLALGGGAIANEFDNIRENNVKMLKKYGKVILLLPTKDMKKNAEIILKRIKTDNKSKTQRPKLTKLDMKNEILKILKERNKFYKKYSDKIIYTYGKNENNVVKELLKDIG